MLQAGGRGFKSRMRWIFSIDLTLPAAVWTQPLTEMGTMNLPGGKKRPARRSDNLAAIC
jgi:hypothetical protein